MEKDMENTDGTMYDPARRGCHTCNRGCHDELWEYGGCPNWTRRWTLLEYLAWNKNQPKPRTLYRETGKGE